MNGKRNPPESLRDRLMAGHNKQLAVSIADWVSRDTRRFPELIEFMVGPDPVLAARAAWAVRVCAEGNPGRLAPFIPMLLDRVEQRNVHPAVIRNFFCVLQTAPIPGELEGRLLSAAMAALGGPVPVAVKVYAMTILKRLAGGMPELLEEIRLLVWEQFHEASPGFRSRARREFGTGKVR